MQDHYRWKSCGSSPQIQQVKHKLLEIIPTESRHWHQLRMWLWFARVSKRQRDSASILVMRMIYEMTPLAQGKLCLLSFKKVWLKETVYLYTFLHVDYIIYLLIKSKKFSMLTETSWHCNKVQNTESLPRYRNIESHRKVQHREETSFPLATLAV